MDLKKRLAQLDRLSRSTATREPGSTEGSTQDPAAAESSRARTLVELELTRQSTTAGPVWHRDYDDPLPGLKGPAPDLREFFTRSGSTRPAPEEILFLDTETTGLVGGTGTMAFLIGVSWWSSSRLNTRQYFLPGPGHETAMLRS
jgi:uncharacterized protein YprB with RNaseH-like and TPR domain